MSAINHSEHVARGLLDHAVLQQVMVWMGCDVGVLLREYRQGIKEVWESLMASIRSQRRVVIYVRAGPKQSRGGRADGMDVILARTAANGSKDPASISYERQPAVARLVSTCF